MNITWKELMTLMNTEMNWANVFIYQTWMGESPKSETKLRDIGETNFKILWESPDGEIHGEMTKELIFNVEYRRKE
jgi:hypothetical protein